MKKFLFTLIVSFLALVSIGQISQPNKLQNFQQFGSPTTWTRINGVVYAYAGVVNAEYVDTTSANTTVYKTIPGIEIRVGDKKYLRNSTATRWIELGTGSGGGPSGISTLGLGLCLTKINDSTYNVDTACVATKLYVRHYADSVAALQTWQRALIRSSTLTQNNTITGGAFNFTWNNAGNITYNFANGRSFNINATTGVHGLYADNGTDDSYIEIGHTDGVTMQSNKSTGNSSEIIVNDNQVSLTGLSPSGASYIYIYSTGIEINPPLGNLKIDTLLAFPDTTNWKPMVYRASTGEVKRATYWPGSGGEASFTETAEEFTGSTSMTVTVANTPKTSKARLVYFNGVLMNIANVSIVGTGFTISGITRETDDIITVKYSY